MGTAAVFVLLLAASRFASLRMVATNSRATAMLLDKDKALASTAALESSETDDRERMAESSVKATPRFEAEAALIPYVGGVFVNVHA